MVLAGRSRSGQPDRESGALIGLGLQLDRPAMLINDFPGYHQAEAGAATPLGAEKLLKYLGLSLFVHATAIVADPVLNRVVAGLR